ncbi:hypothetical protein BDR05DRAFT_474489 [Suillus weaverae]|nr:hypothetical protein BDR05DRAFT_474489 [Suillus weaverae]
MRCAMCMFFVTDHLALKIGQLLCILVPICSNYNIECSREKSLMSLSCQAFKAVGQGSPLTSAVASGSLPINLCPAPRSRSHAFLSLSRLPS